jgi:hypothetical protein
MNAFWKFKQIPKKYYQYPNLTNPTTDVSSLTAGYFYREEIITGRSWKPNELRLKSTANLHKLWFVLLKEKLALTSDLYYGIQKGYQTDFVQRDLDKVKMSMARLKAIMGERDQLRNDFLFFLEFWHIKKSQGLIKPKRETRKAGQLSIEDSNTVKPVKEKQVEEGFSVLTEKEIGEVKRLKKTYDRKGDLVRDYVTNPENITGYQKRKLHFEIQKQRSKKAKEIFLKELSAISYKLKQDKSEVITKLENI